MNANQFQSQQAGGCRQLNKRERVCHTKNSENSFIRTNCYFFVAELHTTENEILRQEKKIDFAVQMESTNLGPFSIENVR